jgi:SulP family sulfate permease
MRHVPFIDSTGVRNFTEIIKDLERRKTKVILSGVNQEVKQELERSEISHLVANENIFDNFEEAINKAKNCI